MTERVLHLHIEDERAFLRRAEAAFTAAESGEEIPDRDHLGFSDLATFLSALSPRRWDLLIALHVAGASSIRALAAKVGRDYKSVHVDVVKLLGLGLAVKRPDGRIEVPFDRIVADIALGSPAAAE